MIRCFFIAGDPPSASLSALWLSRPGPVYMKDHAFNSVAKPFFSMQWMTSNPVVLNVFASSAAKDFVRERPVNDVVSH